MKAFYCDVKIVGTALVYAETADEANTMLADAGVMVAGNKMLAVTMQKDGDVRETYWLHTFNPEIRILRDPDYVDEIDKALESDVPPCRCGHPNCGWCA